MKIFDLEQQMLQFANVTEDIELVTKYFVEDLKRESMAPELADALMNKYLGIKDLYEIKFENMWHTFEDVCKEYHTYRKLSGEEREEELQGLFDER